jgi:hypothetical protein
MKSDLDISFIYHPPVNLKRAYKIDSSSPAQLQHVQLGVGAAPQPIEAAPTNPSNLFLTRSRLGHWQSAHRSSVPQRQLNPVSIQTRCSGTRSGSSHLSTASLLCSSPSPPPPTLPSSSLISRAGRCQPPATKRWPGQSARFSTFLNLFLDFLFYTLAKTMTWCFC